MSISFMVINPVHFSSYLPHTFLKDSVMSPLYFQYDRVTKVIFYSLSLYIRAFILENSLMPLLNIFSNISISLAR